MGVARSREFGGWQALGIPNASPQHCFGPSGSTQLWYGVKPNTPSTTKVGERIDVAVNEPLVIVAFQRRPTLSGLYSAPSNDGKMPWLFCLLCKKLSRLFTFNRLPGVHVTFESIL